MAISKLTLPHQQDTAHWFAAIRHGDWPMLLESGRQALSTASLDASLGARYDILVADPVVRIETRAGNTWVNDGKTTVCAKEDAFTTIKHLLLKTPTSRERNIPFAGGALGYFAYDLGRSLEKVESLAIHDIEIADMMVGIYDWAIVVDHHLQQTHLVSHLQYHSQEALLRLYQRLLDTVSQATESAGFKVLGEVASNLDQQAYAQAFKQVQAYIQAGDCYQINLAQRFKVAVAGDAWQGYQQFKQLSRAPFMAYMDLQDSQGESVQILSMSPERFLQVNQGVVETRPIKGTRPRGKDAEEDALIAQELGRAIKDRAENLMIVDLLRNDLGKVCEIGSVRVSELFKLQTFANVHHLVSIVQGRLAEQCHALDLLKGCFPGGSITGAPKLRAMQIIEHLEPHRRGVYCGSIGYIGFDGAMDTNIAIRTAVVYRQQMTFYAGGGIVTDSTCEKEYQETFDKASHFFKLIEQLKGNA